MKIGDDYLINLTSFHLIQQYSLRLIGMVQLPLKPFPFRDKLKEIKAGDKIIQCVLQKFEPVEIAEVKELSETARADAGFGSSGR